MKSLRGDSERVHIRNVIGDDAESKNDKAEFTKTTGWFENCAKEGLQKDQWLLKY